MTEIPIKWPSGRTSEQFKKDIAALADVILGGTFLAIDPASRNLGTALFEKGKLVNSGTIQLPAKGSISSRLKVLYKTLLDGRAVDLLVIEKIRGSQSHVYLHWAVGVSVAGVQAPTMIEIPIPMWRAVRPYNYIKSDEGDAILMGAAVVALAKESKNE